jgi:TRAP-type C4-dicarboxylate transport system permease small subunit
MPTWLKRAATALDCLLKWYTVLLMSALVVLTFVQVVARYVMESPFTSTPQYARLALVWLTFMGAAVAVRRNGLVRIEVLVELMTPTARRLLETVFDLLVIALLVVIAVKGWVAVQVTGSQVVAGTPLSYAFYTASIFVGAIIMIFYLAVRILARTTTEQVR